MFSADFLDSLATAVAQKVVAQLAANGGGNAQRLFDLNEAATYLGRSRKAVEHLVDRGIIPSTRLDGKIQVDRAKLDKVIDDRTYYES